MMYGHWNWYGEDFNPDDYFGFVYEIECLVTGRKYIGKKNFRLKCKTKGRWETYTSSSSSKEFKSDMFVYGKDNFLFIILHLCKTSDELYRMEILEQKAWNVLKGNDFYNLCINNEKFRMEGSVSEKTKAKLSAAFKGKKKPPRSEEHKANIRAAHIGKKGPPKSEETRSKLSASNMGRIVTDKTRAKISAAHIGKKMPPVTEETRAKLSAAGRGKKKPPRSEHWYAAQSAAKSGKKPSQSNVAAVISANSKTYVVVNILTDEEFIVTNLAQFCRENNLHAPSMSAIAIGKRKQHKGWVCRHYSVMSDA